MVYLSGKNNFKVVVKRVEKPFKRNLDDELNWLCSSLGFFEPIDRDKTAASVFKAVVRSTEKGKPLGSTEISEKVKMSRGSVINHLNNLQRSGLIVRHGRFYVSRSPSMLRTVSEIEEDIDRIFEKMKRIAREIDKEFGIRVD
ncbi:MAG: ArsR family transcriptional regulator, partial [Candidatus Diapherotrites archaeon]|nr:ArsR family transcriptional regulator [Candidatus Diapherotrites archaeon]